MCVIRCRQSRPPIECAKKLTSVFLSNVFVRKSFIAAALSAIVPVLMLARFDESRTLELCMSAHDSLIVVALLGCHPNNKTVTLESSRSPACQIQIILHVSVSAMKGVPWHRTSVFLAAWYELCSGNQSHLGFTSSFALISFEFLRGVWMAGCSDAFVLLVEACFADTANTVALFARWERFFPLNKVRTHCRTKSNAGWDIFTLWLSPASYLLQVSIFDLKMLVEKLSALVKGRRGKMDGGKRNFVCN